MSGTIERIEAIVTELLQIVRTIQGGQQAPQAQLQPVQTLQQLQQPSNPLGAVGGTLGTPQGFPAATAEMITALITPHVQDPNLKAALQGQMAQMGINALPEAQPHQYGELYHRFQQVLASVQAAPQPAAAPASII